MRGKERYGQLLLLFWHLCAVVVTVESCQQDMWCVLFFIFYLITGNGFIRNTVLWLIYSSYNASICREFMASHYMYRCACVCVSGQLYRCVHNSFEFTARFTCGFMAWLNPPLNLYNSIYISIYINALPLSLTHLLYI